MGEEKPETFLSPVDVRRLGGISVIGVRGLLGDVAAATQHAVLMELAEAPAAVICDLSGLVGALKPEGMALLASVGAEVRHWPGAPIGVVSPRYDVRWGLDQQVDGEFLIIEASQRRAWHQLSDGSTNATVRMSLAPTLRSARAARDLVSRACLDWGCSSQIGPATLVVSELVTNAVLHAGTEMEVCFARCGSRLRVAVRDGSRRHPERVATQNEGGNGRGMLIVSALSESWGVLPIRDGGKTVWAVLASPPLSQIRPA